MKGEVITIGPMLTIQTEFVTDQKKLDKAEAFIFVNVSINGVVHKIGAREWARFILDLDNDGLRLLKENEALLDDMQSLIDAGKPGAKGEMN